METKVHARIRILMFLAALLSGGILSGCMPPAQPPAAQTKSNAKDVPENIRNAMGSMEQKRWISQQVPSFAGYTLQSCTLHAYLADMKEEPAARSLLEPMLRNSNYGRYGCKSTATKVEFSKARYTWMQVDGWMTQILRSDLLDGSEFTLSFDDARNGIRIAVTNREQIPPAKKELDAMGIPSHAYFFTMFETFPKPPSAINRDPADPLRYQVSAHDQTVGELTLGKTTATEARAILKKAKIELGSARHNTVKFSFGGVTLAAPTLYTPDIYQLYFDPANTLILIVDGAPSDVPQTAAEFKEHFANARETERTPDWHQLEAPLGPCVWIIGVYHAGDTLDSAGYAYTCPGPLHR